jgi:hypothetical protein
MTTNLRVQGNHIQYILDKILGVPVVGSYTPPNMFFPIDESEYITYELTDEFITTRNQKKINIKYFENYRLTVKNNIFTFQIEYLYDSNNIIKSLTDEQQREILSYLGFGNNKK